MRGQFFNIFLFVFMVLAAPAIGLAANSIVPPTCDSGFYDVLSSRAWMEGQREMEVAETLILKPDSVLEYSCFAQQVDNLAQNVSFAPIDGGINALVVAPGRRHLFSNFKHTMAGGLFSQGNTCDAMFAVWDFLKCRNFDKADFMTFAELAAEDPRALPERCNAPLRDEKWAAAIELSKLEPAEPAPPGGMAKTLTYLDLLDPGRCGSASPIPTGLIVKTAGGERYEDAVCAAPGCSSSGGNRCR